MRWLVVLVVTGCGLPGAPVLGAACTATEPECVTSAEVAYCRENVWVSYACPSECRNLQPTRCDWRQAFEGDSCPSGLGDQSFCVSSTKRLACVNGTYRSQACPECKDNATLGTTCAP